MAASGKRVWVKVKDGVWRNSQTGEVRNQTADPQKEGKGNPQTPTNQVDTSTGVNSALSGVFSEAGQKAGQGLINQFGGGALNERLGTGFNPDGTRIGENQDMLNAYNQIASQYGTRSGETQGALDMQRSLAEQGYNAPEMQAMREQSERGLQSAYQTQAAALRKAQGQGGVRGAAGAAQLAGLNRQRMDAQADVAQSNLVNNANFKAEQVGRYGAAQQAATQTDYQRQLESQNASAAALAARQADELARQKANIELGIGQQGTQFSMWTGAQAADAANQQNLAANIIGAGGVQAAAGQNPNVQGELRQVQQQNPAYRAAAKTMKKKKK